LKFFKEFVSVSGMSEANSRKEFVSVSGMSEANSRNAWASQFCGETLGPVITFREFASLIPETASSTHTFREGGLLFASRQRILPIGFHCLGWFDLGCHNVAPQICKLPLGSKVIFTSSGIAFCREIRASCRVIVMVFLQELVFNYIFFKE
jgi:hypothetical protein